MFKSKQIFTTIIFVALSLVILITTNITKDIPLKDLKSEFKNESSRFVEVDGILVHYTDEGEGTPIILLHGTGASLHTWDLWAEKLKENYRVLRITLPGFGLSGPRLDKRYEIKDYVNLLDSFVELVGIEKFYLVGNSLGGSIAWLYTSFYDEKIKKLILINSSGFEMVEIPFVIRIARNNFLNFLVKKTSAKFLIKKSLKEVYYDDKLILKSTIDRYYKLNLREGNRQAFIDRALINYVDYTSRLKKIKSPTLILWGENDEWINVKFAQKFKSMIKDSRVSIMNRTGHIPMEEKPYESLKIMQDFLME
ncbi:MAG: alpha/beta fold hydrolase [Flavobacteriaceae bacterium]